MVDLCNFYPQGAMKDECYSRYPLVSIISRLPIPVFIAVET